MSRAENPSVAAPVGESSKFLLRTEWILAISATLLLIYFHWTLFHYAGALWRDEVNTVELSNLSHFSEVWKNLEFDSFPILWLAILRCLSSFGFTQDVHLRFVGCFIGLSIVLALWFNARVLTYKFPLWSLLLLGFSPSIITWGDSMRAYGLGILLILLTFGLIWKMVETPTLRNSLFAGVAGVLSVHTLYYNAVLLFAICCGGLSVTMRRRDWKHSLMVLMVGGVAAISLLPYIGPLSHAKEWNELVRMPISAGWLWFKFSETVNVEGAELNLLWAMLGCGAMAFGVLSQSRTSPLQLTERQKDVVLFAVTTLIIGGIGYFIFLRVLSYCTQPWYYVAFVALAAVTIDVVFSVVTFRRGRLLQIIFLLFLFCIVIQPVWRAVHVRKTNIDLIASVLEEKAAEKDLIVVNPWFYGVTFEHYYHGRTDWTTLPEIRFHKFHRYDLIKEKMTAPTQQQAIQSVLDKMAVTLKSGNRVWWIGDDGAPKTGRKPSILPPASQRVGWLDAPYYESWTYHAGYFLREQNIVAKTVDLPVSAPISAYERPSLLLMEGDLK